ncbi:MAG: M23 family metallopeptidase [Acidimicrobiia bacterium]|nr:M23 family metallopeptidase [Acidimicrobiia bacterium]
MPGIAALFALALFLSAALPASASDDFVIETFPHADEAVRFTNDWGDARSGGRRHQGTDIFSPKGSPVVAIADGFVEYTEDWPRAGYALVVRHAEGWSSHYYHLNNDTPGTDDGRGGPELAFGPGIEEGVFVEAGQVIAYVGDSGNAEPSSPHTHFELHQNDRAVNPHSYLDAAYQRTLLLRDLAQRGMPIN